MASEYGIPFKVRSLPCSTRPISWTLPSQGLRISGVSAGMGRYSGFTPRVNSCVQRPIGLEWVIRFLFVQARGIESGIHVPKEPQPESLRRDGDARQPDGEGRQAQPQQAAVDAAGLAKLFQVDRQAPLDASDESSPAARSRPPPCAATRKALAMIVRPGPTPNDVGRKLPSTANTLGFEYIRQSESRTAWAGSLPKRSVPH